MAQLGPRFLPFMLAKSRFYTSVPFVWVKATAFSRGAEDIPVLRSRAGSVLVRRSGGGLRGVMWWQAVGTRELLHTTGLYIMGRCQDGLSWALHCAVFGDLMMTTLYNTLDIPSPL